MIDDAQRTRGGWADGPKAEARAATVSLARALGVAHLAGTLLGPSPRPAPPAAKRTNPNRAKQEAQRKARAITRRNGR